MVVSTNIIIPNTLKLLFEKGILPSDGYLIIKLVDIP
jgi:hypothetical protein